MEVNGLVGLLVKREAGRMTEVGEGLAHGKVGQ
jgi:hypothetical protein